MSGIMLLLAIPALWPYGYYQLLRWVVSVTAVFNAHHSYRLKLSGWTIIMVIVAVIFNPLAPLTFSKGLWVIIDVVVAVTMFTLAKK